MKDYYIGVVESCVRLYSRKVLYNEEIAEPRAASGF